LRFVNQNKDQQSILTKVILSENSFFFLKNSYSENVEEEK